MILPLFASLGELRDGRLTYPADPVLGLVLHKLNDPKRSELCLALGWTAGKLESLFEKTGLRLSLILDDDDTLTEREQRDYYSKIVEFVAKPANHHHRIILAVRPASLEPDGLFRQI